MSDEEETSTEENSSHFDYTHPVPHDHIELEKIALLIERIPDFQTRLEKLEKNIKEFSKIAAENTSLSYSYQIEQMIFKAFFVELEGRPFQAPTKEELHRFRASIIHEGLIGNRNPPCEICGENRSVDRCHVVPNRLGGLHLVENILLLCPTHHRMFDRFMLTQAEFAAINWERKSPVAQEYAMTVTLAAHRKFWHQVSEKNPPIDSGLNEDSKPFIRYALQQIMDIFVDSRPIKRSRIYKILDPHLKNIAKASIDELVNSNLIIQTKIGKENFLAKGTSSRELTDHLILRVWQTIA